MIATPKPMPELPHLQNASDPSFPFFPSQNALIPPHYCDFPPINNPTLHLCTKPSLAMRHVSRLSVVSTELLRGRQPSDKRMTVVLLGHVEQVAAQ